VVVKDMEKDSRTLVLNHYEKFSISSNSFFSHQQSPKPQWNLKSNC